MRWTVFEDDSVAHHWGSRTSSWIAFELTRRFKQRRTTRAVIERARKLGLPSPGTLTKTMSELAATTGYCRSRLKIAMERLQIRPRKVGVKGGWYGVTPEQERRVIAFLAEVPDGKRLRRSVVGQWGGVSNRGKRKAAACIDCGTTDRPHVCRGRCRRCDMRWRRRLSVAS